MKKSMMVVVGALVASVTLAPSASAATELEQQVVDREQRGVYSSNEGCGRAGWALTQADAYWNGHQCVQDRVNTTRWQLWVTRTEWVEVEVPQRWTVVDREQRGVYSSNEGCGRAGWSLTQADAYWNGHQCVQDRVNTTRWQLWLTRSEWV